MMLAGMDVARLNFSHGSARELQRMIGLVRGVNATYRRSVKLLGDLQGHRIRIGALTGILELKKRQTVWLTSKSIAGTANVIPFDYRGPLRDIKNGQQIFIDDGTIVLEVCGHAPETLKTTVLIGGFLKEHKGVNIPQSGLFFPGINPKDIEDIIFCERHGVDYIAQSFVRTKKDVLEVRRFLEAGSRTRIIAKIENREGIRNIDAIIEAADGIMIARGDMGVSLPIYEVPVIQKMIIKKCNRAKKIVITATQMLESMTENFRPTRAEVSDVANAIIDGTDLVMLSAESAVGKYPVQAVAMMNDIIKFTEQHLKS